MNLISTRGETPAWTITCTRDGEPVDLTGSAITFTAKLNGSDTEPVISHDLDDGGIVIDGDPVDGVAILTLAAEDTTQLPNVDTVLVWDVKVVEADGTVTYPESGTLRVAADVADPSPAAAFATSDDFAVRIGLTLTDVEAARVDGLLALASGLIQDATGTGDDRQTISQVVDDVWTTPGTTDDMIKPPQRPITAVSAITLDGTPLVEGADWYLDGNVIRRIPASTTILLDGLADEAFTFPLGTGFGWPAQTLEVTYTHGYAADEIPPVVRAICLEAVVRVFVNPAAVAREQRGNSMTVFDNMRYSPSGLLLTDDEVKKIRKFFGRRARSITIGE